MSRHFFARAPRGALRLFARAPEGALRLFARAPEGALRPWRLAALGCALLMAACPLDDPKEPGLSVADGGALLLDVPALPPVPVSALDVLFVVDSSGSMASEQAKLRAELTRMVHVLTSGDRYADREDQV